LPARAACLRASHRQAAGGERHEEPVLAKAGIERFLHVKRGKLPTLEPLNREPDNLSSYINHRFQWRHPTQREGG
jgi:hypothetical protein